MLVDADSKTISEIGEKRLISDFVRPFFNRANSVGGVGDDCAMIDISEDSLLLASTDRVPANLIAFELGLLDHYGLGRYLACLNLSDIAACGGTPEAMLLNMGLPGSLPYRDFAAICTGFGELASSFKCPVLGGDITESAELSISATAIGRVRKSHVLTRRGATDGDVIFVSRPIGLTPAAFAFYRSGLPQILEPDEIRKLNGQFTQLLPMFELSSRLVSEGVCTSCMDNTDGIGQSFTELAEQSGTRIVINLDTIVIPDVVRKVAVAVGEAANLLALGAGADFSLVGTLRGNWTSESAGRAFGLPVQIIGRVERGSGVFVEQQGSRQSLSVGGWNYFAGSSVKSRGSG